MKPGVELFAFLLGTALALVAFVVAVTVVWQAAT